jgi:hypothetical protein
MALLHMALLEVAEDLAADARQVAGAGKPREIHLLRIVPLVPLAARMQGADFFLRLAEQARSMSDRLARSRFRVPACTAEEILLKVATERLEADRADDMLEVHPWLHLLPETEADFDWASLREVLTEDSDVDLLYDPSLDGIEDERRLASMAFANLAVGEWFTPFR